jgi:HD-GYP domain-containing protein (c-di-GMP phosphodiesterase class II)
VAILVGLCEAIDARPYMEGHGSRVSALAEAIALRLGWGASRIRRLRIGALLHDVGKLSVADTIWDKAERLNDEEVEEIRRHPAAGARILARQLDFRFAIPHVLFHHEHWDGGGYPSGRRGDAIPLEARVLAVADAFDAMTSPRPYRPALAPRESLAEIARCAGTQFDPLVAGTFVEVCRADAPRLFAAQG